MHAILIARERKIYVYEQKKCKKNWRERWDTMMNIGCNRYLHCPEIICPVRRKNSTGAISAFKINQQPKTPGQGIRSNHGLFGLFRKKLTQGSTILTAIISRIIYIYIS